VELFLTPADVAELFGITVQAVHKMLKEHGIATQLKGQRTHKIYPDMLNKLLEIRGGVSRVRKSFAIHTLKGGVGKSTLCHALGSRASCYGFKTLMIDLDKQANLTNSFGISDDDEMTTMLELYEKHRTGEKGYDFRDALYEISPYLHIIPARLELANLDLSIQLNSTNISKLFPGMLKGAKEEYDLILFDLPADFNRVTMATHAFADCALIPINMDAFSIKGLKLTQAHVDYVRREFDGSGDFRVIINKFDARNTLSFELMADLKILYKDTPFLCSKVIPVSKPIETAFASGENLWSLARTKVPALEGFESVLFEMMQMDAWKNTPPRRSSKRAASEGGVEHGH